MLTVDQSRPGFARLVGRFDAAGAGVFEREVRLPEDASSLALDFSAVDFLSSAGIRSLLKLDKQLKQHGGRLLLAALPPFVTQTLELSGLLGLFLVCPSAADAQALLERNAAAPPARVRFQDTEYDVQRLPGGARVELWGGTTAAPAGPDALVPALLSELPLAFGVAGFGAQRAAAAQALGLFVSAAGTVAVAPADGQNIPDFIQADNPEEAAFYVAAAIGLRGRPDWLLEIPGRPVSLGEMADLALRVAGIGVTAAPFVAAFAVLGRITELAASLYRTAEDWRRSEMSSAPAPAEPADILLVGLVCDPDGGELPGRELLETFRIHEGMTLGGRRRLYAGAVCLGAPQPWPAGADEADNLRQVLHPDRIRGVARAHPETRLAAVKAWLFRPVEVIPAARARLQVEVRGGSQWPDEWDIITRRIYADSSRVALTQLSGGYSATTFQVDSYDAHGRRMIPTVLKLSTLDFTAREEKAYHEHVKKFILNNSTVIMGRATQGEWAGLRYNFVGVNGPDSTLSWLADHYLRRPVEELKPLFNTLFSKILWPWYGQPRHAAIRLYAEHDPGQIFPRIAEDARQLLGVDPEASVIRCPELGMDLPNPYHFLGREFPRRGTHTQPGPTAITHGDLNLNNILLDEKENMYVIDFSETRPRNIVADFARLEPLLALQMTRLDGDEDLRRLTEFAAGLTEVAWIGDPPPLRYTGDDPMVAKAWHIIGLLRRYAGELLGPKGDMTLYWLPLLQWTLPLVSFRQLDVRRKRLSMYGSALICRKIMEGERSG